MKEMMKRLWSEDEGQGLVEYALIIALVSVALIAVLTQLKGGIGSAFNEAKTELTNSHT